MLLKNLFEQPGSPRDLTSVTSGSQASVSAVYYDSGARARRLKESTNTLGNTTSFLYDDEGNLTHVTDPMLGVAKATPMANGLVGQAFTPANPTKPTTYGYNPTSHQLTSVTPPTGNSLLATGASYDGFGRLKEFTSGEGVTTTFEYDLLDRLLQQTHDDGQTPAISHAYHPAGTLHTRTDGAGTTTLLYDQANRLTKKTTPAGELNYTWDRASNLTLASDPTGTTTYHYDKVNRLDQVNDPVGRKTIYGYDQLGRRDRTWHNTGADVAYSGNDLVPPASFAVHTLAVFENDGLLKELKTTRASSPTNVVSHLTYKYAAPDTACPDTPANQPTTIRHTVKDEVTGKTTRYCYDRNGRLTSATTPGGSAYTYSYDANTNRVSGPEGTHTVNSADQLTDAGYQYDHDGNLTEGGGRDDLAYTGTGQTASIAQGGVTTSYSYAGAGQGERIAAGPTTALHGMLGLATETTGGATTSYIRNAGGSLIAERTPVGDFYYVFDGRGSVIALIDPNGTQRAAYTYDPFGAHATATAMNGSLPPNPWRWSGAYLDATGLYKMGARYYDADLGRFTQVDPLAGGSCNQYDYACGDPINFSDPTGTLNVGFDPNDPEIVRNVDDCRGRAGPEYASSDFCRGFLTGYYSGDLTAYGFGFEGDGPGSVAGQVFGAAQVGVTNLYGCIQGASFSIGLVATGAPLTGPGAPYVVGAAAAGGCVAGVWGINNDVDFTGPSIPTF
ncbi:MAG: RHS repeat-associated core domain-containing protein [Acidimicrobiales bacterium]